MQAALIIPPHRNYPYEGTGDTVAKMLEQAHGSRGMRSLPVRMWVENAVRYVQPRDTCSQLIAIYRAFVPRFRYVHDPSSRQNPNLGVELVKDAQRLVEEMAQYGVCLGDCDDAAGFLYTAPRTIGICTELARVGFRQPRVMASLSGYGLRRRFTHIFAVGHDQYGRKLVMDPVAGARTPRMLRRAKVAALGLGGLTT